MDDNFNYAITDNKNGLGLNLIKGFNSFDEIREYVEQNDIHFDMETDLVKIVDPSIGLHHSNVILYAGYYYRQIYFKEELEEGNIDEEEFKNELWKIEARVKDDIKNLKEMSDKYDLE